MENLNIEVLPKKSVRKISYLGTPICLALGFLIIWDSSLYSQTLQILMIILGSTVILMGILWLPHIYKFKITFGPDSIRKYGLFTRQLSYKNIQKLIVRKGFIEVQGENIFQTVSIGDLYTNFDVAADLLSTKVKENKNIDFTGKEKYINKYFNTSSN